MDWTLINYFHFYTQTRSHCQTESEKEEIGPSNAKKGNTAAGPQQEWHSLKLFEEKDLPLQLCRLSS